MAYQMAQTPVTLNDLESHSSVSELFKCKASTFLCSTLQDFNWHAHVEWSLSDSWVSCTRQWTANKNLAITASRDYVSTTKPSVVATCTAELQTGLSAAAMMYERTCIICIYTRCGRSIAAGRYSILSRCTHNI